MSKLKESPVGWLTTERPPRLRGLVNRGMAAAMLAVGTISCSPPHAVDEVRVGPTEDGGSVVPTRQLLHPAGRMTEFHGRPVDVALAADGKTGYVKADASLFVLDLQQGTVRQEVKYPNKLGASLHGIAPSPDGKTVYVTLAQSTIGEFRVRPDGTVTFGRSLPVRVKKQGESYPNGLAIARDGRTAYVCLSCNNCLAVVDLVAGQVVGNVPVGLAPYAVVLSPDGTRAYVSNWGGRRPTPNDKTSRSAGTDVVVDDRGIASTGSVSVVDVDAKKEIAQVATGLHPSDVALSKDGETLYVANANGDTVSVIDTASPAVRSSVSVRPDAGLLFGSAPNALTLADDGRTLLVANGGNNAIAVVKLDAGKTPTVAGFVPTAWYPGAVAVKPDGEVVVVNVKGVGTRDPKTAGKWSTRYGAWGSVTQFRIPTDAAGLAKSTAQVKADAMVPPSLAAMDRARDHRPALPVPARAGEPSVFDHVVYVIKENRTYDQVLGDVGKGNSDPSLCIYGKNVTPNQHALADEFVLLDNYYCNGILSPDGHQWATEGITTDFIEKSFGAWVRSYPSTGDDPLAYSTTGFIWDDALRHGRTFRNYGEFRYDKFEPSAHGAAERTGLLVSPPTTRGTFKPHLGLAAIEPYTCPDFPGWTTEILDVRRADVFIRELHEFEKNGRFPNLSIVYLPNNHTNGMTPSSHTPNAMVADNDLAVGKIVDALSHGPYWKDTCVFVTEDDPQDGFDHVDGHRSSCLVVSPYTRRGAVVSNFYNQTSVLHTIELMLGLPPMNQFDALSPAMGACFATAPDPRPWSARPNVVSLDDRNPPKTAMSGTTLDMAEKSLALRLDQPDLADEETLNRILWFAAKGERVPYPKEYAGPHGKGLERLGLKLAGGAGGVDDD